MSQAKDQTQPAKDASAPPDMVLLLPGEGQGRRDGARIPHGDRPVRLETAGGRAVFPDWDQALDDSGCLRRCLLCGESHMYRQKRLPQLTGLVVVLAFTLALLSILGLVGGPIVLACMVGVLLLDVGILLYAPVSLACYGCHTEYRNLRIGHWHKPWNRAMAGRFQDTPDEPG